MAQKCRFLQVYNVSSNLEGDWVRTTKRLFCDAIDAGSKTRILAKTGSGQASETNVETKTRHVFCAGQHADAPLRRSARPDR